MLVLSLLQQHNSDRRHDRLLLFLFKYYCQCRLFWFYSTFRTLLRKLLHIIEWLIFRSRFYKTTLHTVQLEGQDGKIFPTEMLHVLVQHYSELSLIFFFFSSKQGRKMVRDKIPGYKRNKLYGVIMITSPCRIFPGIIPRSIPVLQFPAVFFLHFGPQVCFLIYHTKFRTFYKSIKYPLSSRCFRT